MGIRENKNIHTTSKTQKGMFHMDNSQNIKDIIKKIKKATPMQNTTLDTSSINAVFEIIDLKDIEKIISGLDDDKKAKLLEILKKIK